MEKLTLKEVAPYLSYELMVKWGSDICRIIKCDEFNCNLLCTKETHLSEGIFETSLSIIKPILRPLSDLTKEIEHNGERFVPLHTSYMAMELDMEGKVWMFEHELSLNDNLYQINKLFEWHFDVFGLIPKGLAIDKNTIEPVK